MPGGAKRPEYYVDTRFLKRSEVAGPSHDTVILHSLDNGCGDVYEIFRTDGSRVGKLDKKRRWADKIIQVRGTQPKVAFLERLNHGTEAGQQDGDDS